MKHRLLAALLTAPVALPVTVTFSWRVSIASLNSIVAGNSDTLTNNGSIDGVNLGIGWWF